MILCGDSREVLQGLPDSCVSSVVTDPPYELGFMGKAWDSTGVAYDVDLWKQALRVLRPGGHLLAFGGSRTYHRLGCAVEDAGFEIRDQVMWIYGSGFPKSRDVSKAIDEEAGAERVRIGRKDELGVIHSQGNHKKHAGWRRPFMDDPDADAHFVTAPATDAARQWDGWGTALKPAHEIVVVAQKQHDLAGICAMLAQRITESTCRLQSLVKDAGASSTSSQSGSGAGAFGSAQWTAVERCSTPAALYDLMATWPSESETPSSLSIAFSWLDTLAGLSEHASTFTTETASSLTTDLRILLSCPSATTPESIIEAATLQPGTASSASPAASIFNAARLRLEITLGCFALGPATSPDGAPELRPKHRPIVVARKPFEGTVAANVLEHGTGALNVDGCRVGREVVGWGGGAAGGNTWNAENCGLAKSGDARPVTGRWPANIVHDGSEEAVAGFPEAGGGFGVRGRGGDKYAHGKGFANTLAETGQVVGFGDSGSAARFFYCCKPSAAERQALNDHATVKPVALMRWLVRLITPPNGLVLDPFLGSGTTGIACEIEGFPWIGIEKDPSTAAMARERIARDDGAVAESKMNGSAPPTQLRPIEGPLFAGLA